MTARTLHGQLSRSLYAQLIARPASRSTSSVLRSSRCYRYYSSNTSAPPLLAKLTGDLKAAMKAKDAPRLAVLRAVLAATLNASKTASPVQTDAQLVAILRKQARQSREAADDFRVGGREDLVQKEEAQIKVLEEYATGSGVQALSEDELRAIVGGVLKELAAEGGAGKVALGDAMKKLLGPGGPLDGKDVAKADVVDMVKNLTLNGGG